MDAAALRKHAARFGTDGVMETVADLYHARQMSLEQAIKLQEQIDQIDRDNPKNRYAPRPRLSAEVRVKRLLGIEDTDQEGQ